MRDKPFAILYLFDLLVILVLFFLSLSWLRDAQTTPNSTNPSYEPSSPLSPEDQQKLDEIQNNPAFSPSAARAVASIGVVCMLVGVVVSSLWLQVIKKYANVLIKITMWASVVWNLIGAIVMFSTQLYFAGVIFLCWAIASAAFYWWWRARIPFATVMLETVAELLQRFPGTIAVAYGALLTQFVWLVIWLFAAAAALTLDADHKNWIAVFLVFSFFWTSQVIKNIVHTTTSGTVASWYFLNNTTAMPKNPTRKSLTRAVTTSFGSICFGSLLIAVIKTAHTIVRWARDRIENTRVLAAIDVILGCLENLVHYFNHYAFTQVAIYGKPYCAAATDTWNMIKDRGFEAIVNDNLISNVLWFGCFISGVISACISGIWAYSIRSISQEWPVAVTIGFFIGFVMMLTCMEIVESAVASIFVCFADAPEVMRSNMPELYGQFETTYSEVINSYV
eukprot:TRINITY_DN2198_c0_g1_i1.p1 TRINITY_DN2198_c0_g1~~TRINITY_DN2198_c0_g1_i1.p1  ORF type:complete len:450 (+),score=86.66 TRINITY_DN2198_c0_g1_i1:577-1926(+)